MSVSTKPPYSDLESQYTKQIEILISQINKGFIQTLKQVMDDEGVDDAIIRKVKLNAFKDTFEQFSKLTKKFKSSSYYQFKTTVMKMEILFSNADKRVKKLIAKTFTDAKMEIPVLKLKRTSDALRVSVDQNIELISGIVDKHTDDLQKAVLKAMRRGFDYDVIKEEVLKQADKGLEYAKFVSRDQLAKAHANINEERQKASGIPGYIGSVIKDGKERKSHVEAYDGKFILWNDPPLLNFALDGDLKRKPEKLHCGHDYQCRCLSRPAFDSSYTI